MRRQDLVHYRQALSAQLSMLLSQGEQAIHQRASIDSEDVPDPNDRATIETDRGRDLRLLERDQRLIAKIQIALQRIEEGTFGVCDSCGGPIGEARLRARPVTNQCIECKTEAEQAQR
jgi:DnaK suppressor protein